MRNKFRLKCDTWHETYSRAPVGSNCFRFLLTAHEYAESRRHRSIHAQESHPSPDPNKYRSARDARDWQNPYLMVQANGIDARPSARYGSSDDVTCGRGRVLGKTTVHGMALWPCRSGAGERVRAPGDDARIKRNREELVRLLENAGIKVNLWPSA